MCTTGIRVVALLVSLVPTSLASCCTEFLRLLIHASLPRFYVLALLVVKRYYLCTHYSPSCCTWPFSAECAVDSVEYAEWGNKYDAGVGFNRATVNIASTSLSPTVGAAITASLLITAFPQIFNAQTRRQDKIAAYTTWSFTSSLMWYDLC
jgi:hypothetical protein